jgi:hypothetical protein
LAGWLIQTLPDGHNYNQMAYFAKQRNKQDDLPCFVKWQKIAFQFCFVKHILLWLIKIFFVKNLEAELL